MASDTEAQARDASEPLYSWWLDLIGSFMGRPGGAMTTGESSSDTEKKPFPVAQVSQALALTQQLMGSLYQTYFQALSANPQTDQAFQAFQDMLRNGMSGMQGVTSTLSGMTSGLPGLSGLTGLSGLSGLSGVSGLAGLPGFSTPEGGAPGGAFNLLTQPMSHFAEAMKPISLNMERAYGGLADAFGLAPSRELQTAAREMATATIDKRRAQAEFLALVMAALGKGTECLMARLNELGKEGKSVDTLLGLIRLWAQSADAAMHTAMQSPPALEASAKLLRASNHARKQQQTMVAIASQALNVPTRAEVDDAYREIQELKRELRRVKKLMAPVHDDTPPQADNGRARADTEADVDANADADHEPQQRPAAPAKRKRKVTP